MRRARGLALTGVAALLAVACLEGCAAANRASPAGGDPGAGRHELLGDAYVGQGDLDRAYFEYREALRLEPRRAAVLYKTGRLLVRRGHLAEAERQFHALLALEPGSALARLGLGHAAFLAGKPEAEQLLRDAIARDAGLWQAHDLLGLFYERGGSFSRAVSEYYAALAIDPGQGPVANNLGVALLRSGDARAAVLAFERARDVGCDDPRVFNNLGVALARLGRRDEAIAAFLKAGTPAAAWNNLGLVLLSEGKEAEAVEAFENSAAADSAWNERAQANLRRARQGQ